MHHLHPLEHVAVWRGMKHRVWRVFIGELYSEYGQRIEAGNGCGHLLPLEHVALWGMKHAAYTAALEQGYALACMCSR